MIIPTANLWTSGIVFVVVGVLAQAAAFRWAHRRRFWLIVDYGSLFIAGVSILSAIDAVRKQELSWRLPAAELRANHAINYLAKNLDWNVKFHRDQIERFKQNGYSTAENEDTLKWFTCAAELAHEENLTAATLQEKVRSLPPTNSLVNGMERQFVFLSEALRERDEARAATTPTGFDWFRLLFAPWLLAAALALRLGKSTADYRRATFPAKT